VELGPGTTFGAYRIEAALARGGMGAVYRAYEEALDRSVALKVLPAELLHERGFAERFKREARLAAKLEHPHIVPIHAYGIEGGHPWMALRLITGGSLAEVVQGGRLDPVRTVEVLRDVADALDHAHRKGVIHRDVKPQNVLLDDAGRAYLADFGIARMLESSSHITATGMIQGTPAYMAPEQAEGKTLGPACDIYALGVMAYQCMVGRVPFSGTPVAVLVKHVNTPPPLPSREELKPSLTAVLHRCLAKDPDARWESAEAFVAALDRARQEDGPATVSEATATLTTPTPAHRSATATRSPAHPPRRKAPWRGAVAAAAAAAVVVLASLGLWWAVSGRATEPQPPSPAPVAEETAPPEATPTPSPSAPPVRKAETRRSTPSPPPSPEPTPSPTAAAEASRPPEGAPAVAPAEPTPPEPEPTPPEAAAVAPPREGPIRVFVTPRLEPRLFDDARAKDVEDSTRDIQGALDDMDALVLADGRATAEAVIEVLERGKKKMLGIPSTRQVRIRVTAGRDSIELLGQDKALGFNTWKGAAKGALRDAETWLEGALRASSQD
jgi:serine/threonine-protein kinase